MGQCAIHPYLKQDEVPLGTACGQTGGEHQGQELGGSDVRRSGGLGEPAKKMEIERPGRQEESSECACVPRKPSGKLV